MFKLGNMRLLLYEVGVYDLVYMGYAVFVSFNPQAELYGPTGVFPGGLK